MIKAKYKIKKKKNLRIRNKLKAMIRGTEQKPRLFFFKSNKYFYAQVINDENHKVISCASTLEKVVKEQLKSGKGGEAAELLGKTLSERLKEHKVEQVVFDRNVYPFMGNVKKFADSVRSNGIKF